MLGYLFYLFFRLICPKILENSFLKSAQEMGLVRAICAIQACLWLKMIRRKQFYMVDLRMTVLKLIQIIQYFRLQLENDETALFYLLLHSVSASGSLMTINTSTYVIWRNIALTVCVAWRWNPEGLKGSNGEIIATIEKSITRCAWAEPRILFRAKQIINSLMMINIFSYDLKMVDHFFYHYVSSVSLHV